MVLLGGPAGVGGEGRPALSTLPSLTSCWSSPSLLLPLLEAGSLLLSVAARRTDHRSLLSAPLLRGAGKGRSREPPGEPSEPHEQLPPEPGTEQVQQTLQPLTPR